MGKTIRRNDEEIDYEDFKIKRKENKKRELNRKLKTLKFQRELQQETE
jgi:hypothetical protein